MAARGKGPRIVKALRAVEDFNSVLNSEGCRSSWIRGSAFALLPFYCASPNLFKDLESR